MAAAEAQPFFSEALVFLTGAVIAAPIFKRIGLGTVLGYLAAGIVLGPILRYVHDGEEVLHFAELGIVFLLFIIGLELNPSRLWRMRNEIFGLGFAQVVACGIAIGAVGWLLGGVIGLDGRGSIVVGLGLALSSTAFAMQLLEERGEISQPYGRRSFSILLFQDLAIVPLLLLVAVLAPGAEMDSPWQSIGIALGAIAVLIGAGLYLLDPLLRVIARTGAREVMLAAALVVVLGSAALMQFAGLSMAMGAFIAGVLLSESSYRHELEADIEPFRGLLLGLFFMAVGMSLDLGVIGESWLVILIAVPVLLAIKGAIIYGLSRAFGSPHAEALRIAALLPQGGEFAFVLFSAATASAVLDARAASVLIAVVTITMALTPLTVELAARSGREDDGDERPEPDEDFEGAGSRVLMIGFSRLGQIAYQTLLSGGFSATIIDNDPDRIAVAARFGSRIYYGDGTRMDVLEAAGIAEAEIVAVCTADHETTRKIVGLLRDEYPQKQIFARSFDRNTSLELLSMGVDYEVRETLHSAMRFGREMLVTLGMDREHAEAVRGEVERRDNKRLQRQRRDGIEGGRELLNTEPQTPTPLDRPDREAEIINDEEYELGHNDNLPERRSAEPAE